MKGEINVGRKSKPPKVFVYMKTDSGEIVPWESLTEEEKEYYRAAMNKNLSRRMSAYYAEHPEEYEKLRDLRCDKTSRKKEKGTE